VKYIDNDNLQYVPLYASAEISGEYAAQSSVFLKVEVRKLLCASVGQHRVILQQFLAAKPEVPGSIPGATEFSE
jgi:hypothetical protein